MLFLNLKSFLTTLVSFAGALVLWVGQEGPVQLSGLSLQSTRTQSLEHHIQDFTELILFPGTFIHSGFM